MSLALLFCCCCLAVTVSASRAVTIPAENSAAMMATPSTPFGWLDVASAEVDSSSNHLPSMVNGGGGHVGGRHGVGASKAHRHDYNCRPKAMSSAMRRVLLSNANATCNDGSPSGYYIRRSKGSRTWLLFLEGGWYCHNAHSCRQRLRQTPKLMSSHWWSPVRHANSGILSANPRHNPLFWRANIVFLPYCSSDAWSGRRGDVGQDAFSFDGANIIDAVVDDLLDGGEMQSARRVLFAGASAGGIGVMLSADRVAERIRSTIGSKVEVRALVDSAWFVEEGLQDGGERCLSEQSSCAPMAALRAGVQLWRADVPAACAVDQAWRCFFPHRLYRTLATPLFVVQFLYDEAQMAGVLGESIDVSASSSLGLGLLAAAALEDRRESSSSSAVANEWVQRVQAARKRVVETLRNVSAVFAPSCMAHVSLTRRNWHKISINDITLGAALRCWWRGRHEPNHQHYRLEQRSGNRALALDFDQSLAVVERPTTNGRVRRHPLIHPTADVTTTTTLPPPVNRRRNRRRRQRNRRRRRRRCRCQHSRRQRVRERRSAASFDSATLQHRWTWHHTTFCQHQLIDECLYPHCNAQCPSAYNPFTGEAMARPPLTQLWLDLVAPDVLVVEHPVPPPLNIVSGDRRIDGVRRRRRSRDSQFSFR